jgi:hypothetical protein
MNIVELEKRLLAAAKANPPSDAVPYAFEQRIMAQLRARPRPDHWAWWANALWRAVAPSLGVVLLLGAWALVAGFSGSLVDSLDAELETTVYAAIEYPGDLW